MRLTIVEPGSFSNEELGRRENYAKSVCSPRTDLQLVSTEPSLAPNDPFILLVPSILERVKEAERDGYDAVVIDCFTDVGLEAAKTAVDLPIVGPCESSLHIACLLADKFGWVTPSEQGIPSCWRRAKLYGMASRITSIKAVDIPFLEYHNRKAELESKLISLIREMMNTGAQLALIGCTAIFPALGIDSAKQLSAKLGITIIDPIGVALNIAEVLVRLNLSQSKVAFPRARIGYGTSSKNA